MTTATAGRRVRVNRTRSKGGLNDVSREILEDAVDKYMQALKASAAAAEKMQAALEQAKTIMETSELEKFMTKTGVAEMLVPRSNTQTTIDPRQFRAKVTDDDEFYSAVTIGVEKAKKVLGEKALDAISTKIKPEPKPPVLKIRPRTEKD